MKIEVIKRVLAYLKKYSILFLTACVCAILYVLFSLLVPVIIGNAVDGAFGVGAVNFGLIIESIIKIGACTICASLFQWVLGVCTRKASANVARDIRSDAYASLNKAPLNFIDTHAHGDVISRMVNDTELISDGLLQGLTQFLPGIATILGTLIVMLVLNPIIALVVVLVTPISILFAGKIAKKSSIYFKKQANSQGDLSAFINEMVTGQNLVKQFGAQNDSFTKLDELTDSLYDSGVKSTFYSSVVNPGTRFVNAIVYAAVGVIGAIVTVGGTMTVGQLSCFLSYANQYTKPFNEISGVITQLQNAQAGAERLFEIIDVKSEKTDSANAIEMESCNGNVKIDDVAFSYVPQIPLIEGFNLNVASGKRVAIVGPTGCGKTTLINLLMRFYDVNSGTISVDDTPIQHMTRNSLRQLYGMVLQDTWLKNASVLENITYGRPNATKDEVVKAAKAAYAHSFIKRLPQGYDTIITQGGGNLSAGQKQLLCIARIMLCQPDMLILDEATSSIDTRTEMLVQQAFEKLMKGRTSFVVAHRLSTIQTADIILVMKSGHIIEQGTHQQLLMQKGFYEKLYKSQFEPV